MRIKNEHVRFIVDWILSHPEIEGFTIRTSLSMVPSRLQIILDLGFANYSISISMEAYFTETRSEMLLREALETEWHKISYRLKNQSSYRESRYS